MAWEQPGFCITLAAAADLSGKQFYFVKMDANGKAAAMTSIAEIPIGILQNKPNAAGAEANIMMLGISKLSADAALTIGSAVSAQTDGQGIANTTNDTSYAPAIAMETVSAADEILTVWVCTTGNKAQTA